jgi:hypothetical protein
MPELDKVLENNFTYHPPSNTAAESYKNLRDQAKLLAYRFKDLVPDGRERLLAMTKLEEAIFWANAGIARKG